MVLEKEREYDGGQYTFHAHVKSVGNACIHISQ